MARRSSVALEESIMRYLGRGVEAELGDVVRAVRNDYGDVSERTVGRYLKDLAQRGVITRRGSVTHYTYQRATKLLSA